MRVIFFKPDFSFPAFILFSFLFSSCSKSTDSSPQVLNSFVWIHQGVSHTATVDTAFVTGQGLALPPFAIIAGYPRPPYSYLARVEFDLSSFTVGNYSIGPNPNSPTNRLRYIADNGIILAGIGGSLHISAKTTNTMTGDFSVTVTDGINPTTEILTGSFANMPIVQ